MDSLAVTMRPVKSDGIFPREVRANPLEVMKTAASVVHLLAVMTKRQRRPGVGVRVVTQSQQFRPDTSELVFVELCELFSHLLALVGVDRLVVVARDLYVVLPELSLVWRSRRYFFHFQKDAAHDVDAQHVRESDQQADAAKCQQLDRFVIRVGLLFQEVLEAWVNVLKYQVD